MKLAMVKEVLSPAGRAECLGEVPLLLLRWEDQVTAAVDLAGAQVGDRVLLVVAAGDAKVDNRKYKDTFGGKATMLGHDEASERIGHAVGGVCPFALPEGVEVYLDVSMKRFETVFPAAGSDNSAIEMTLEEMERYSSNFVKWVDVCKNWQGE